MPQYHNGFTGQTINVPAGSSIPNGPGCWQQIGAGGSGTVQGGYRVPHPTYNTPPPSPAPSMFPSASTLSTSSTISASSTYTGGYYPSKPLPKWIARLFRGAFLTGLLLTSTIAALFAWRGNLSISSSGIQWIEAPPIQTLTGTAYRMSDMNRLFLNRNPQLPPVPVLPNSSINAGPLTGLNLICPQGDFTIKGDVYKSRIFVPNGTLTIDADLIGSSVAARNIVTHGLVVTTRQRALSIQNTGTIGINDDIKLVNAETLQHQLTLGTGSVIRSKHRLHR